MVASSDNNITLVEFDPKTRSYEQMPGHLLVQLVMKVKGLIGDFLSKVSLVFFNRVHQVIKNKYKAFFPGTKVNDTVLPHIVPNPPKLSDDQIIEKIKDGINSISFDSVKEAINELNAQSIRLSFKYLKLAVDKYLDEKNSLNDSDKKQLKGVIRLILSKTHFKDGDNIELLNYFKNSDFYDLYTLFDLNQCLSSGKDIDFKLIEEFFELYLSDALKGNTSHKMMIEEAIEFIIETKKDFSNEEITTLISYFEKPDFNKLLSIFSCYSCMLDYAIETNNWSVIDFLSSKGFICSDDSIKSLKASIIQILKDPSEDTLNKMNYNKKDLLCIYNIVRSMINHFSLNITKEKKEGHMAPDINDTIDIVDDKEENFIDPLTLEKGKEKVEESDHYIAPVCERDIIFASLLSPEAMEQKYYNLFINDLNFVLYLIRNNNVPVLTEIFSSSYYDTQKIKLALFYTIDVRENLHADDEKDVNNQIFEILFDKLKGAYTNEVVDYLILKKCFDMKITIDDQHKRFFEIINLTDEQKAQINKIIDNCSKEEKEFLLKLVNDGKANWKSLLLAIESKSLDGIFQNIGPFVFRLFYESDNNLLQIHKILMGKIKNVVENGKKLSVDEKKQFFYLIQLFFNQKYNYREKEKLLILQFSKLNITPGAQQEFIKFLISNQNPNYTKCRDKIGLNVFSDIISQRMKLTKDQAVKYFKAYITKMPLLKETKLLELLEQYFNEYNKESDSSSSSSSSISPAERLRGKLVTVLKKNFGFSTFEIELFLLKYEYISPDKGINYELGSVYSALEYLFKESNLGIKDIYCSFVLALENECQEIIDLIYRRKGSHDLSFLSDKIEVYSILLDQIEKKSAQFLLLQLLSNIAGNSYRKILQKQLTYTKNAINEEIRTCISLGRNYKRDILRPIVRLIDNLAVQVTDSDAKKLESIKEQLELLTKIDPNTAHALILQNDVDNYFNNLKIILQSNNFTILLPPKLIEKFGAVLLKILSDSSMGQLAQDIYSLLKDNLNHYSCETSRSKKELMTFALLVAKDNKTEDLNKDFEGFLYQMKFASELPDVLKIEKIYRRIYEKTAFFLDRAGEIQENVHFLKQRILNNEIMSDPMMINLFMENGRFEAIEMLIDLGKFKATKEELIKYISSLGLEIDFEESEEKKNAALHLVQKFLIFGKENVDLKIDDVNGFKEYIIDLYNKGEYQLFGKIFNIYPDEILNILPEAKGIIVENLLKSGNFKQITRISLEDFDQEELKRLIGSLFEVIENKLKEDLDSKVIPQSNSHYNRIDAIRYMLYQSEDIDFNKKILEDIFYLEEGLVTYFIEHSSEKFILATVDQKLLNILFDKQNRKAIYELLKKNIDTILPLKSVANKASFIDLCKSTATFNIISKNIKILDILFEKNIISPKDLDKNTIESIVRDIFRRIIDLPIISIEYQEYLLNFLSNFWDCVDLKINNSMIIIEAIINDPTKNLLNHPILQKIFEKHASISLLKNVVDIPQYPEDYKNQNRAIIFSQICDAIIFKGDDQELNDLYSFSKKEKDNQYGKTKELLLKNMKKILPKIKDKEILKGEFIENINALNDEFSLHSIVYGNIKVLVDGGFDISSLFTEEEKRAFFQAQLELIPNELQTKRCYNMASFISELFPDFVDFICSDEYIEKYEFIQNGFMYYFDINYNVKHLLQRIFQNNETKEEKIAWMRILLAKSYKAMLGLSPNYTKEEKETALAAFYDVLTERMQAHQDSLTNNDRNDLIDFYFNISSSLK